MRSAPGGVVAQPGAAREGTATTKIRKQDKATGKMNELKTAALIAMSMMCLTNPVRADAATVSISCGAVGIELQLCKGGAEAWAKTTGNEVKVVSTPNDSNARLALYQQLLASGSNAIDVFQIDVVWPGILQNYLVDMTPYVDQSVLDAQFQVMVRNDMVKGRLVALPWFTDAGILYYRKDLLEKYEHQVPETWADLTATASDVQAKERTAGHPNMWGYVWQGRAYEGLTCDALEWVHSFGGGTIVDPQGKVTIDNPMAIKAVNMAAGWVGTITPIGVLNYAEEESRGVFQTGNAVFMRNWPYAWRLVNSEGSPVKGLVGVAQLPKGGPDGQHTGTLGGWQLAVSKYSKVKDQAVDLVKYLTSEQEQKRRAIVGGYNPTYKALYQDKEVLAANPLFGSLYDTFVNAVARPSRVTGIKYNPVSNAFWNAVHSTLAGEGDTQMNFRLLTRTLHRLSRGGRHW
jgi:trehalose/maltose transport system substrate-binding protein